MCDRHRTAARDLLGEARNDAPGAAENVAETHQHELRRPVLEALADDFGEALGRPHDAGRVHRLVGRHQHELLDLGRHCGARQHPGPIGIVAHRLPGVGLFHQRDMLVGGGVKNRLGLLAREHAVDERDVLDVADVADHRQPRKRIGERGLDHVERRFGNIEKHQPGGSKAGDLRAQLGADRAPAPVTITTRFPSHSPSPALSRTIGSRPSRSSSSILRSVVRNRAPADQVFVRRHRQRLDAGGRADLGRTAPHTVLGRRQRDDHLAHAETLDPLRERRDGPQYALVAQQSSLLADIVVDQTDDTPLPAAREFLGQPGARFAGTDDQHRLAQRGQRAVQPVLLPYPVRNAAARHQENEHDRVEDEDAARHDGLQPQHHQHDRDKQRPQSCRKHDLLEVGNAREPPEAAIETEGEEDRRLQRHDPGERPPHGGDVRLADIEIETQPVHRGPGQRCRAGVVGEREPRPPIEGIVHCFSGLRFPQ